MHVHTHENPKVSLGIPQVLSTLVFESLWLCLELADGGKWACQQATGSLLSLPPSTGNLLVVVSGLVSKPQECSTLPSLSIFNVDSGSWT